LSAEHRDALQWFYDRQGQEVSWAEPLENVLLISGVPGQNHSDPCSSWWGARPHRFL